LNADLLTTLLPLGIGTALVPIPLVVTVLLLRSPGGRGPAFAWVAGMMSVRLLQGLLFGIVFAGALAVGGDRGPVVYGGLLVLAVVFLVAAARKAVDAPEDDAPPPRWLAMLDDVGAGRAYLLGFGMLAIGLKHWVFTLGAIAAILEADPGPVGAAGAFLAFVLVAHALQIAMLVFAVLAPERADRTLASVTAVVGRHSRPVLVVVSLVFGLWFLAKGLSGLGVI
jgi:hypothetical protein